MSSNPINLGIRFLLELAGLVAMGYWGWHSAEGGWRWLPALGVPIVAAVVWGTFRVENDPGKAPVRVPGVVRLLLELAYFGFAAWSLYDAGAITLSWMLAGATLLHYAVSYDRILWLLRQ